MTTAKLIKVPKVTPNGLLHPPVAVEDSTIGRSGQIQGAKIVTSPDTNAKESKIIIVSNYILRKPIRASEMTLHFFG